MSIINSIVEEVIGKLGEALLQPIIQEAYFLHGVADKLRLLQDEFRAMQSFLEDADAEQVADQRVKYWLSEVREVARDAGDAIDIFVCKITPAAPVSHKGLRGKLQRYGFTKLIALHDLGRKIEGINAKIAAIARERQRHSIHSISRSEIQSSLRRFPSPYFSDPDFVGLKEQLNSLIDHLIKREPRRRCAVSLVGMGGLGKTTLAVKAYNHEAVMERFSCRAWVSVSHQYSVREVLLSIGRQCSVCSGEELQRMTQDDLSSKIFGYLKNRTYLMVLDDIWERGAWDDLKHLFPDERNGSRILLTTRIREVALYADVTSTPHELPLLKEDESWQLFCKKAFLEQEIGCPLDLEPIGREIVKKCGGLPLAIIFMGRLLSTKRKEASKWRKVLDSIPWQFGQEQEGKILFEILSQSYRHLPNSIKPCFLYLACFPEDCDVPADRLIRLWAAEGFLKPRGQETPEEMGESILMELISRNLIQVADTSSSGLIESCRIHDLLRHLCVSKAREEEFIVVHPWSSTSPSKCKGSRLALHCKKESACTKLVSPTPHHHLRSVFLFNENQKHEMLETGQQQLLFVSFKMLRVLDLEQVLIREIPSEIGELVHLRYLRCSNTRMRNLPASMTNLSNLQTLDVVRREVNGVLHIPSPVEKMLQGLRHLRLVTYVDSSRSSDGCRNVEPYIPRNFFDIIINGSYMNIIMRYEERVGLEHTNKSSLVSELSLIDKSFISASSSSSMLQRPLLTSSHLLIDGILSKLPDQPRDFPSKLSKLELKSSCLKVDPLPLLEKLENLRFLVLDAFSYEGKEMACSAIGFPQLQSLHLRQLYDLELWRVEAGAMPCLSDVLINYCPRLKMLPEGLKHLTKLRTLEIEDMPPTFTYRIRAQVGEDWHKIQHIPSIKIGREL